MGCLKANTLVVLKCFNSRTHFPPHQEPGEERPLLLATGSLMRETLSRPGSVPPASGDDHSPGEITGGCQDAPGGSVRGYAQGAIPL